MSVQPGTEDRPSLDFVHQGDVPFGALMDALVADDAAAPDPGAPAAPGGPSGGDPAPAAGSAPGGAPGGPDAPGDSPAPAGPAAAAGDGDAAAADGAAPGAAAGPADGGPEQPAAPSQPAAPASTGLDPAVIGPQISDLSNKFEETVTKAYQQQAYEAAREDYGNYFDALEKHPRLLVGTEVPRIGAEGMETLRNSEDAKEWQEAVRSLLVQEIREKAETKLEESREFLDTVHASIDLFKNNPDLIPGTKGFDRDLADRFAAMAKPYEIRDEDSKKLLGYSIPVQPLIEGLRAQLGAQRVAAPPASPPSPTTAPQTPDPSQQPQAGITSKAGNSSEREDFSTLFGTIGLPNLQI